MSTNADKFWAALARKSAGAKHHGPFTAEGAQNEYDAAEPQPISEAEIESLVEAVVEGRCPAEDAPVLWDENAHGAGSPALCLNRNPASAAPADDAFLDEHRRKALGRPSSSGKRLDWKEVDSRLAFARQQAVQVLDVLGIKKHPVQPKEVAASERTLQVVLDDFGDRFDGQLEYHASAKRFLLFVNTKYDHLGAPARTRFSFAHELAHFFLDQHRTYLMGEGKPHASHSEFSKTDALMEQEADAFAASLLMPERIFAPFVNEDELTLERIESLAAEFETSLVSTAIRAVEVSHFPCAVAGIRDGCVAWQFVSQALIEGRCYPRQKGSVKSPTASERWAAFRAGEFQKCVREQYVNHWFRTYDSGLDDLPVTEYFLPVPVMETLVVLLTVPERDLFPALYE